MHLLFDRDTTGLRRMHLVGFLTEFHALGLGPYLHQQAADATTPAGRALLQGMDVFACF
jgi:hypothetical protein